MVKIPDQVRSAICSYLWMRPHAIVGCTGWGQFPTRSGGHTMEILHRFQRIPRKIQCDFYSHFIGGKVKSLLMSHVVRLKAAPPQWKSQNGLVKSYWTMVCQMVRDFLVESWIQKRFWFRALRECVHRMNMLSLQFVKNGKVKECQHPMNSSMRRNLTYGTCFHLGPSIPFVSLQMEPKREWNLNHSPWPGCHKPNQPDQWTFFWKLNQKSIVI